MSFAIEAILSNPELGRTVSRGHNQGLESLLEARTAPKGFKLEDIFFLRDTEHSVILADICGFAIDSKGRCSSILRDSDDAVELYVPISSKTILVSVRAGSRPSLTIPEVNSISCRLALREFFAARSTSIEDELSSAIGTGAALLSDEEIGSLVSGLMNDL
jgi:hypothetical protein